MDTELREWLKVYMKGLAMGTADAVPGVSGGTIAFITGIYERLIKAVSGLTPVEAQRTGQHLLDRDMKAFREHLSSLDVPFLAVLGTGIMTAVILVLRFMDFAITNYPAPTYGFFTGLIAVSAVVLYKEVDLKTTGRKAAALTGFSLAFIASGFGASAPGHALPLLFFSGLIAVSGMVLPGISGSLILVIFGQYDYMSATLTDFTSAIPEAVTSFSLAPVQETAAPITVFITGAFAGLFTTVHGVRKALDLRRKATMVFLVSMIAGATRAPILQLDNAITAENVAWTSVLPEFSVAAIAGGLTILFFASKSESL